MSGTMDLTAYDAVLKDYFTEEKIKEQSFYDNPLLAMMPRKRAGGRQYTQPIEFGNPGGASASFFNAMQNSTTSRYSDFLIRRKKQYQRILVDHELLLSSEEADEAFQPAFDEFDRGYRSLGEKLARRLYRGGGGCIGQLATVNAAGAQLVDKADVFNFQLDQIVNVASLDTAGVLRGGAGATLTVTNLDREAGIVTFNAAPNSIGGVLINDFIVPVGDYDQCLFGLEDWLPVLNRATKLAATFNGVVRNVDADRLGGIFLDGTKLGGTDEVLIKLVAKIAKHGGRTSHIMMNPETFSDLQLLWNSKNFAIQNIYTQVKGDGGVLNIGFPGMQVNVGGMTVKIYGDRSCPSNRIHALQMNTWRLWHSGDLFGFLGEKFTGKILKLAESEDSLEGRVGSYCNPGCSAPGWNGVAQIAVA